MRCYNPRSVLCQCKGFEPADGSEAGRSAMLLLFVGTEQKGFFFCSEMDLKPKTSTDIIVNSRKLGRDMFYRGKLINWDGRLARMAIVSEIKDA